MATTAVGALLERFTAAGLPTTYTGGLWLGQAPEDTGLPLLVLVHQGEEYDWTTETGYVARARVTFLGFVKGAQAALDAAVALHAAYDWCGLSITGGSTMRVERTRHQVVAEDERAADGEQVYRTETDYVIEYSKG